MHQKAVFLIFVITTLTFANSLGNGFVGDDEVLFTHNTFYKSPQNIIRLFQKSYLTQSNDVFMSFKTDFGSGSVAYRPMLTLSYFWDYGMWKEKPFGYHLMNLVLHILNSFLVYFLFFFIGKDQHLAFWGTLLFAVHPMRSEAVCSIGYRADLLSTFLGLLSFLLFLKFKDRTRPRGIPFMMLSWLTYFLAVFSKESVIIIPLLIFAYDFYYNPLTLNKLFGYLKRYYGGYIVISLFYLFIYFKAFPNTTLKDSGFLGGSLVTHVMTMLRIFWDYVFEFSLPFLVNVLPALYAPSVDKFLDIRVICSVGILLSFAFFIRRFFPARNPISFFLLWFLISYIPVSNIVPLVNPMAHRFMYFPSIGLSFVFMVLIERLCRAFKNLGRESKLGGIVRVSGIALCVTTASLLNSLWKNNFIMASAVIKHFPDFYKGYTILGIEYFRALDCQNAKFYLNKSLQLGSIEPRIQVMLGMCSLDQFELARDYFIQAIREFPQDVAPYQGLGKLFLRHGKYEEAILSLEKSLEIAPAICAYEDLIKTYLALGEKEKTKDILVEASKNLRDQEQLDYLQKIIIQSSYANEKKKISDR